MKKTNIKNTKAIQNGYVWKVEKQLFNQKHFVFGMTLHAHAQYIYIVNAKYQKPSVKALVQVDFPVYAQAKSLFKSKQEKKRFISKAVILSKTFFFGIKLLDANVQWVYIV